MRVRHVWQDGALAVAVPTPALCEREVCPDGTGVFASRRDPLTRAVRRRGETGMTSLSRTADERRRNFALIFSCDCHGHKEPAGIIRGAGFGPMRRTENRKDPNGWSFRTGSRTGFWFVDW